MRIVCDENMPGLQALAAAGARLRCLPGRAIRRFHLVDADALLVRSVTPVNQALLTGTPVRFVGTATSGTDHIDRAALRELGIAFADAAGANANAVAEYVLAVLAALREPLEHLLAGGRVGIVGYGNVGRSLGARLDALGIAWVATDPWLAESAVARRGTLAEIFACDVVTLHCSLTELSPWPSRHLLDRAALERLAAGTLLINASRGPVVDNDALQAWLVDGRGRAVLDVWEREPEVPAPLLARVALGTPHIAGYSLEARLAGTRCVVSAMDEALGTAYAGSLAPPPASVLALPATGDGPALLRKLLLGRYAPGDDDRQLRAALAAAGGARAAAFDRLRRAYPLRRELAGNPVSGGSARVRELAAALGCEVL
ncbi:4-phosphoerythronate dehydrogenase [Pseudohaliea rubra]|uniref:Erythronate-4-phosphate dehydrogenase n=1 Tax=Pseudohaliea rubra DSM 19751 TaxID=1265313 RepID=A0A095VPP9_9GAMM|nr:4-phosphoerythronate dehydrogenase [Pseudohaliea rubra]KGE03452.1 Erythronate-4-phosphate dehydrogenase [Pseudohaliea rubra DSM 19751]